MMHVYATQHDGYYVVQVGSVEWQGRGTWQDVPLPQRKLIVSLLMCHDLELKQALEDCEAVWLTDERK